MRKDTPTERVSDVLRSQGLADARTLEEFSAECWHTQDRISGNQGLLPVLDLGLMPNSNSLIATENLWRKEQRWPLELAFSPETGLCQIVTNVPKDTLFNADYPYFSSMSEAFLEHSRVHCEQLISRYAPKSDSLVVELASNDGYLLKNFVATGIPVLGIDPAPKQVQTANDIGVRSICAFFGEDVGHKLLEQGEQADIVLANNVLAHVSDQNDFVAGIATILKEDGVVVVETPYVRHLVDRLEFDTIYHEHFCYFSCTSAKNLFARHGLYLNDVEEIPVHGGSLRLSFGKTSAPTPRLTEMLAEEERIGLTGYDYYVDFGDRVRALRVRVRAAVATLKADGKRIAAYGAAAKGAIALNFFGLDDSVIDYVVDLSPYKQGLHMPGQRIPIKSPDVLIEDMPDVVIILTWNFADEIMRQQRSYLQAGGVFMTLAPEISFYQQED